MIKSSWEWRSRKRQEEPAGKYGEPESYDKHRADKGAAGQSVCSSATAPESC